MDRDEWLRLHKEGRFWGHLAWVLALPGLLFLGIGTLGLDVGPNLVSLIYVSTGLFLYCAGLAAYARGKGLHPAWGLMGLSCLLGFVLLRFMPRRCRGCERACAGSAFDCPGCGAPL